MKRLILEMGIGTDLYGGDYTKAACRAVRDAAAPRRALPRWAAGTPLTRLLDGRLSCQQHLFAAVSLTSPQSALEAETACHSVSSGRSAAQNDVQRPRDGPVY